MSVLVIAEHDGQALKKATLCTIAAAAQLGEVHVLIAGSGCFAAAQAAAQATSVAKVLLADEAAYAHAIAEAFEPLVTAAARNYSHVLAPATTFGKNLMPRVAAMLDVAQISEIVAVVAADTFKRPIYAGNVIATVQSTDAIKVLTVRATAFDAVAASGGSAAVEPLAAVVATTPVPRFVGQEIAANDRPELTSARVIVSGGRALGSAANFHLLDRLADKLGAAVGASRAAVDAGYAPNDWQVGQTGKIVAPDLYIAVGISGAIQHMAGMKDSKVIVAINKDPEAPIFQIADYGLVADLFEAVPELTQALA